MLRYLLLLWIALALPSHAEEALRDIRRIVFLGDSITYSGQYIETIDAYLATAST